MKEDTKPLRRRIGKMKVRLANIRAMLSLFVIYPCFSAIVGCSMQGDTPVENGRPVEADIVSAEMLNPAMEYRRPSCAREIGVEEASMLARTCLRLSPATHPPCNVENSCAMIKGEIGRSCEYLRQTDPAFHDEQCSQSHNGCNLDYSGWRIGERIVFEYEYSNEVSVSNGWAYWNGSRIDNSKLKSFISESVKFNPKPAIFLLPNEKECVFTSRIMQLIDQEYQCSKEIGCYISEPLWNR